MEMTYVKVLCLVSFLSGGLLFFGSQILEKHLVAWRERRHQVNNALLEAIKALSTQVEALPQSAVIEALTAQVKRLEKRERRQTTSAKSHINGAAASSTHTSLNK